MSDSSIPVVKFLFREEYKTLSEALKLSPSFGVENYALANDLATFLSTTPAALIVTSLKDKNDLIQIATFLKVRKKVAKDIVTKIVVVNFSGDRTFEKAIAKLGIQDFIEPTINTKALKFKIDFWMKSLNAQSKMSNAKQASSAKVSGSNSADGNSGNGDKKSNDTPIIIEPLELEDDIWLIKATGDCKKILGKWLVRIMGPSPYVGQWNELKPGLWRYEIKEEEKEIYVPNEGAWFFSGDQKPDFVWKENIWLISGDNFNLFFKNSKQIFSRINAKDRVLTICKNSIYAKTKEPFIIESFDKEMVFRKEAENLEDLEGKSNTDQIDGSNLKGKNSTAADRSGNLSGKTDFDDQISDDNLEGKSNTSKDSKFWGGKQGKEEALGGNSEGAKAGGSVDSPLLESKDEMDHQKYYKNHNEPKKYLADEEDPKKRQAFREEEAKDLTGKTETDKVPKYYDGKDRSASEKDAKGKDSDLSGKGDTDHLKSHYGGKNSKEVSSDEDPSGKSSTDRIDAHYGGKNSREASSENPSGKSSTDKIDSHYGHKDGLGPEGETPEEIARKKATETLSSHYGKPLDREARTPNRVMREAETYSDTYEETTEDDLYEKEGRRKDRNGGDSGTSNFDDEYGDQPGRRRGRGDISSYPADTDPKPIAERTAEILPLEKARNDAARKVTQVATDEAGLQDITGDARVSCTISSQQKRITSELNDFFDDTIVFLAQDPGLTPQAAVSLNLSFKLNKKDTNLTLPGVVSGLDSDGEGGTYVTVTLSAENVFAFGKFMELYKTRQGNVDEFLKLVKGL